MHLFLSSILNSTSMEDSKLCELKESVFGNMYDQHAGKANRCNLINFRDQQANPVHHTTSSLSRLRSTQGGYWQREFAAVMGPAETYFHAIIKVMNVYHSSPVIEVVVESEESEESVDYQHAYGSELSSTEPGTFVLGRI